MMNYKINFTEAARVMPQKITADAKAMRIADLKVSAKLALDASNDGNGVCLTIRLQNELGNYAIINYDPRRERVHYQTKLYITKEIVDKAVCHCLKKLEERFPMYKQLTIDDTIKDGSSVTADEPEEGSMCSTHWRRPEMMA